MRFIGFDICVESIRPRNTDGDENLPELNGKTGLFIFWGFNTVHDVVFLVVDDSHTIKMLVKKVIENKIGAKNILMANDGREALEILNKNKVDFILCDREMPRMSGDDLLLRVRQHEDWKTMPFIIMTSQGGKDLMTTAAKSGVTHYLVKPFTSGEMEDLIRKSWNATAKRGSDRFSALPPRRLVIKNRNKSMDAKLMDISRTGCLVRMEYHDELRLFGVYELSLEFDTAEKNKTLAFNPLSGVVMRLESDPDNVNGAGKSCQVAIRFNPKAMDKVAEQKLDELVKLLASLSPNIIGDK